MMQRTKYLILRKQIPLCFLVIVMFFIGCQTANSDLQEKPTEEIHSTATELSISAEQFTKLGEKSISEEDEQKAIEYFTMAIKADPTYALAYTYRGGIYEKLGQYRLAMRDLEEAIKLSPDLVTGNKLTPYFLYGMCNYKLGNYELALLDMSRVLEMVPIYSPALYYQGMAYNELGQYQESIDAYTKGIEMAIKIGEPLEPYYYNRGLVYLKIKDYEKSIYDLTIARALNPHKVMIYCNRGIAYYQLGQYDAALADFNMALELEPHSAIAYFGRGLTYSTMNRYEEATEKKSKLDPHSSQVYFGRGAASHALGRFELAISDFNQAIELNPNDANMYKARGTAYLNLRKYREAIADFDESIRLNPNDEDTYERRDEAYRRLNPEVSTN